MGLVKGWGGLSQTPGDAGGIFPADKPQNTWLNVPLLCVWEHLLTFGSFPGFDSLGGGKLNVICPTAIFHTCEEDKAFIKDWEYGHGSRIKFQQTSWSYSAWMQTSPEGLSEGSTLANHCRALFMCNFALFVILNYIWEKSIVSLALK